MFVKYEENKDTKATNQPQSGYFRTKVDLDAIERLKSGKKIKGRLSKGSIVRLAIDNQGSTPTPRFLTDDKKHYVRLDKSMSLDEIIEKTDEIIEIEETELKPLIRKINRTFTILFLINIIIVVSGIILSTAGSSLDSNPFKIIGTALALAGFGFLFFNLHFNLGQKKQVRRKNEIINRIYSMEQTDISHELADSSPASC